MSQEGWGESFGAAGESSMDVYERVMGPRVFVPLGERLLDELTLEPGATVLDVACGPGSVTRLAAARVGSPGLVIGCDLSAAMLAIARAKPPVNGGAPIEYLEAPAERLPVAGGAVDVVACQQGLQFFGDRAAALTEMRRALRPGGRVGIAVWAAIERCPPFNALRDAVEAVVGAGLAERYRAGPWGFPDGERLAALIERAGFELIRAGPCALPVSFEDGPKQVVSTLAATPLAAEIRQLSDEDRARLVEVVATATGYGPISSTIESNLVVARRP